jgi:membrane-associated HD superfamily phosphohydrolase
MKPWVKNAVGILSHIPGLYMLLFMGGMIFMITHTMGHSGKESGPPILFIVFFICHILVMLLMFLLIAFWAIWLIKGSNLPQEAKILWALAAFFIGPIIMPILYWLYLRKSPDGPYFFGAPFA